MKIALIVFCVVVFLGCTDDYTGRSISGPDDFTKPRVEIVTPPDNCYLGLGEHPILAKASDNSGVAYVRFQVGKYDVYNDRDYPYNYWFKINKSGPSSYSSGALLQICATAFDYADNWTRHCIIVNVRY